MKNLNRREDDDYNMLRAWRDNTLYMDIPKDVIYGMDSKRCDLWYSMDIFWNGPGHMEKKTLNTQAESIFQQNFSLSYFILFSFYVLHILTYCFAHLHFLYTPISIKVAPMKHHA